MGVEDVVAVAIIRRSRWYVLIIQSETSRVHSDILMETLTFDIIMLIADYPNIIASSVCFSVELFPTAFFVTRPDQTFLAYTVLAEGFQRDAQTSIVTRVLVGDLVSVILKDQRGESLTINFPISSPRGCADE
jgi:hypothetical protein